ncbi:MAG: cysteine desulfurase [bacterium]|nr:cysteine desulfurase [bacterium]
MVKSNVSRQSSTKADKKIYMDYASSVFPNASSIHQLGVISKQKLENARVMVSSVLFGRPKQIVFTSGGTESNNLAIIGTINKCFKHKKSLPHIVTTNIEHPSVLETCKMLDARGLAEVTFVPVEKNGIIDPKKIKKELKENTVLVSVMYANNEIGTIQPIKEIAKEIRHYKKTNNASKIIFHTDAVQASNYLELNVERLGVDMLSLSGSKIENSGKVGILYVRDTNTLSSIFYGGDQEFGLRAGTENVGEIVKFADALEIAQKIKEKESKRLIILQKYFLNKLQNLATSVLVRDLVVNGDMENRLSNNVNITIPNIPSDLLVIELSAKGVYVSSKSACKSGDGKVSHVIKAVHPETKETDGSLRFSFGRDTKKSDIDYTVNSLKEILIKLKKWYS